MKRRMTVAFGALFFASCFIAFAQSVPIGIDFQFEANEKALEPGTYTFELVNPNTISIVGPGGRVTLIAITRLALMVNDSEFKIVFDKINNEYLLSEVWFPGKDGFLVLTTSHAHEHRVLGAEAHPPK